MKRWWLISAIGAVSALVLLQLTQSGAASPASVHDDTPESTEAQPPSSQSLDTVRVEHVLVEAEPVRSIEYPDIRERGHYTQEAFATGRPDRANLWRTPEPRATTGLSLPRNDAGKTPPPLFQRAKRAFLGDGRHRPEPFPRVKDN